MFEYAAHFASNVVLKSGRYSNHTSTRVIKEVNRVKDKRLKIYPLLLIFIESGRTLDATRIQTYLNNYNIYLNHNDVEHLKSLLDYLESQPDILVFLRAFHSQYKNLLEEAIGLIISFESVDRQYLSALITGNGIHREDAEIIVDAYYWSHGKIDPKFITIERKSIESNKDLILHILHHQCTDFPKTGLELLNIFDLPT